MLKILVVEDNQDKLRHIVTSLQQVSGCSLDNIDQVAYANEAKRAMKEKEYDLLILDVALPARPDQPPSAEAGIELLQEVLDRQTRYFRPKHIVGLTAFSDILNKVVNRFTEDLWLIIQYDPTSNQWAEQLRRKVEYILLAERSHPIPDYGMYLGIVAALQSPELSTLLNSVPWKWRAEQLPSDASNYYMGSLQRQDGPYEVVAVAAPRMGMIAASVATMKLISAFRPQYIAMIGIAAGIKGRCQIGDIVVAEPSWEWPSGKITKSGSRSRFQQSPHQIPIDSFLRAKLSLMEQDGESLDSIRRAWNGSSVDHVLRMFVGPMASGSAVLADKTTAAGVVKQHRKLLAIDMETYGVYAAAQEAPLPQPKAFSMKSICDYADANKDDQHHGYASFTSARALQIFAERYM